MGGTGRNDSCPCGSGRKYKRCCLEKDSRPPPFTTAERRAALAKLDAYVADREWNDERTAAAAQFWGPYQQTFERSEDESTRIVGRDAFDMWFAFDRQLADGTRVAGRFLSGAPDLTAGERRYVEQALHTRVKLYEVVDVRPGESLTLRDLRRGVEVSVRERLGSRSLHRWDIVAARVMPRGASGHPEIDATVLPLPRIDRERLMDTLQRHVDAFRHERPEAAEGECHVAFGPILVQEWLRPAVAPRLPELRTSDGAPLVIVRQHHEVTDPAALTAALDSARELEREGEQAAWVWLGPRGADGMAAVQAVTRLTGERLVTETLSEERAVQARRLIERCAGDALRFRGQSVQSPAQALAEAAAASGPPPSADVADELAEMTLASQETYYRGWLDEQIPALGGRTPRQAAKDGQWRPGLVELLKDLEHQYELALTRNRPAYDPSWMWDELGFGGEPESPGARTRAPLLGHESIARHVPGIGEAARDIAERVRRRPGFDATRTITREELGADLDFMRFVRGRAEEAFAEGARPDAAAERGNLIGAHLEYLSNFELHRRKTFLVDGDLAWMLRQTLPDVTADLLRLPFACFALVFGDRPTLAIAERLLATDPDCELRGRILRVLSVYITELSAGGARGLRVAFTFDALAGQWPYLLVRDLRLDPELRLDSILDSHFPDVDPGTLAPLFSSSCLRRLLGLVINAILYATSPGIEPELRSPPAETVPRRHASRTGPFLSSEAVYFLPGTIDISHAKLLQRIERAPGGAEMMHRFMVRGHWRRAPSTWKDRRPRWIKPYWKGPDLAAIVERDYRLKP